MKHSLQKLIDQIRKGEQIQTVAPVGGGSINETAIVRTNKSSLFVKWNNRSRYPDMFRAEADGLDLLRITGVIRIPSVLGVFEEGENAFLTLECIDQGSMKPDFWEIFGSSLAALHKQNTSSFGLNNDNYIGSLKQSNRMHESWNDFFVQERLLPQAGLAFDDGKLDKAAINKIERLAGRLSDLMPQESPALLHGDLWSGNFMVSPQGEPVLIDPAVYYGHREMDLAMTKLFGGFNAEFYTSYHSQFPLEKGWQKRVDLFNLYPLLVHVNLFGGGYLSQVKAIIGQF